MTMETRVPARYYARFCDVLESLGTRTAPLLDASGIDAIRLRDPQGTLSLAQVEALFEAATRATGRSDLALELGHTLKLTSHVAVSHAILSSPTAGHAMHLLARYFRLILPIFRMNYGVDDRRQVTLTLEPTQAMSHACLAFHLELVAIAVHWGLRELLEGQVPSYDVYYSLEPPPHLDRYAELPELRPHFGWRSRPGLRIQWPPETAGRALGMADSAALELAEQRCNELVANARRSGDVAGWVTMMLREASGGLPALSELADTLNLSPRTLDRYLKKEGVSFRALHKQVRQSRACAMLADNTLSVTEIALELGYTDASNFASAFRREAGCAPTVWRERQQLSEPADAYAVEAVAAQNRAR